MKLIITEKPSVARTIAEVIGATHKKNGYLEGNGYLISWCIGHLVELVEADAYKDEWKKWSYETLPIIPEKWQHSIKPNTQKQYKILEELLHKEDVSEVICATDAGREGELIFRLVYLQAGCKKPIKRLWISSMEEAAISGGLKNLKPGSEYENLYQSALCRSKADWLVGINGTRLFTVLYGGKTLKVGRVQTPTLAMLVEREEKIRSFVKEQYFITHLLCEGLDAVTDRIDEKKSAERIAGACQNGQALVVSLVKEEKNVNPPKLYDLTTLQRDANRLLGYTAKQTLEYTQSLYEKKLLTYPRTDSQFLTEDMEHITGNIIHAIIDNIPFAKGILYTPNIGRVLNSKKVSDHHAIIPTIEITKIDLGIVPKTESAILYLVANRLLCATGDKHTYETIKAVIECGGEKFTVTGKTVIKNGWKDIEIQFKRTLKIKEDNNTTDNILDEKETELPNLSEGMVLEPVKTKITEHYTSPPKHFTEDTLLAAMEIAGSSEMNEDVERKGLGTPATRADIIEKLVRDGFVVREKKQMLPTEDGMKLISVLPEVVKSPQMTADWENDLTLVARGEKDSLLFMQGIKDMVKGLVDAHHIEKADNKRLFAKEKEVIGHCPKCGNSIYESKVNFYCDNKECNFALFKNNKYFASMGKEITKTVAKALINKGRVNMKGLYSTKKDRTFDAIIIMSIDGQYPQFSMEFETKGEDPKKTNKKA